MLLMKIGAKHGHAAHNTSAIHSTLTCTPARTVARQRSKPSNRKQQQGMEKHTAVQKTNRYGIRARDTVSFHLLVLRSITRERKPTRHCRRGLGSSHHLPPRAPPGPSEAGLAAYFFSAPACSTTVASTPRPGLRAVPPQCAAAPLPFAPRQRAPRPDLP